MKKSYLIAWLLLPFLLSCDIKKERMFLLTTDYGDIKFKLYNETPLHRDNFTKLVEKEFYDGLIFHRVINRFMIQGGNPSLKNPKGKKVHDPLVDAEFVPTLFHQKGAVAAARMGDEFNPQKRSSSFQFYIVHGKTFTDEELTILERRMNDLLKIEIRNKLERVTPKEKLEETVEKKIALQKITFTEKQREIYKTIGGAPHLDGNYTVFGQVTEGFEVIDKIAATLTDEADKPVTDIKMTIKQIK